jgi:hypothetical protein
MGRRYLYPYNLYLCFIKLMTKIIIKFNIQDDYNY